MGAEGKPRELEREVARAVCVTIVLVTSAYALQPETAVQRATESFAGFVGSLCRNGDCDVVQDIAARAGMADATR